MRTYGILCTALLLVGCAGGGSVIQTPGTTGLGDIEVARVSVPGALTLLTVDGERVAAARGHDGYEVRLAPGPRRLRFAYEEDWGKGNEYDWIYSDHIVEVALNARPGVVYSTGYPVPGNRRAARRLAGDLRVWIDDPDGARAESRVVAPHGSPLARLMGLGTGAGAPLAADSVEQAETLLAQQDALERLKLWWKLASDEQRRQFQRWIEAR